jgi:NAD-dependent SIR2 family protein deacetylase
MPDPVAVARAAEAIAAADGILFTTGAGMGVDSGLPDFRGDRGFWRAYPAYERLGLSFSALANPRWFDRDPTLAWGFYGHRLELYRRTVPHAGYALVRAWSAAAALGGVAFTSNVDGQLQRAGFDDDRIVECHGAIQWLQCTRECGIGIYPATDVRADVDPDSFRAREPLPKCPSCGALARPNVLMFGDDGWTSDRTDAQFERLEEWLGGLPPRPGALVVVECGAGKAVPTVRSFGERCVRTHGAVLVRINAREAEGPRGTVSIDDGALAALSAIDAAMVTSPTRTS